jgi:mannose-6-phosphate isomerase-like protein (cupin superfamily)
MLKKHDAKQEYYFEEGCYITEISNSTDDEDVSIARARVEEAQQTKWHYLENTTERYVIVHGEGLAEIGDGEPLRVSIGDVVVIPPDTRQRIKNTGKGDLVFLVVCSPRFHTKDYHAISE